jgi:Enoyl-(Acyl carrier protein) reductase
MIIGGQLIKAQRAAHEQACVPYLKNPPPAGSSSPPRSRVRSPAFRAGRITERRNPASSAICAPSRSSSQIRDHRETRSCPAKGPLESLGPEHHKTMAASIPLKRLGTVGDIGYAALFLASKEAGYITGQTRAAWIRTRNFHAKKSGHRGARHYTPLP